MKQSCGIQNSNMFQFHKVQLKDKDTNNTAITM